jgi:hypothetical protein
VGSPPGGAAKKLIGAARHWAGGGQGDFTPDQGVIDALIATGAPQHIIDLAKAGTGSCSSDYELWPENEEAVDVFLELSTSWDWVTPGMGKAARAGLRSTEIESTLRMLGYRGARRAELFRDIRIMERAALEVFQSR